MPTSSKAIQSRPDWLVQQQAVAQKTWATMALPSTKEESWRYTALNKFDFKTFSQLSPEQLENQATYSPPIEVVALTAGADFVLYFYNGVFLPNVSRSSQAEAVTVTALSKFENWSQLKALFERKPNEELGIFGQHQKALWSNGAYIHVESSKAQKISVVHLYGNIQSAAEQTPITVCPRNIYHFAKGATAQVSELHISTNSIAFLGNSHSEFILDEGAKISCSVGEWFGEDAVFINDTRIELAANAKLEFCNLTVAGQPTRNQYHCELAGAGAEIKLLQAYAATDKHHIDNSSAIFHRVGDTKSEHVSKGVVNGRGRIVFSGQLRIEQDAQKSDASQLTQSLLLSSSAEVDARPQLEVYADDVKAAHGASIGELNRDEIFYLQSRGVSESDARQMLGRGYLCEVVGLLQSAFTAEVLKKIIASLPETYFAARTEDQVEKVQHGQQ